MNASDYKTLNMQMATRGHESELIQARVIARRIAVDGDGRCSIIKLRDYCRKNQIPLDFSHPWAGSIFKTREWEFDGFDEAEHAKSHGHVIRNWKLKEAQEKAPVKNPPHHGLSNPPSTKTVKTQGEPSQMDLFSLPQTPWDMRLQ